MPIPPCYPLLVLNPAACALLADSSLISAQACQRALRILGDYDLTRPRLLIFLQLDRRYGWPDGTAEALIRLLASARVGLLLPLEFRSRPKYPVRAVVRLAPEWILSRREQITLKQDLEQISARERTIRVQ